MNRNSRKQEVATRVKEMKQRQHNWMKQRAEYQGSDKIEESPHNDTSRHSAPVKSAKSLKKDQSDDSSNLHNLLASKRSNAKFEKWRKAKHEADSGDNDSDHSQNHSPMKSYQETRQYNSNNYMDSNYGNNLYRDESYRDHSGSKAVNVLRVPSSRSPEYATPDPSFNSEDETGEITATQLLSPEDFDAVADSIINKVKGDMGIGSRHNTLHTFDNAKGKSVRDEHYGKTRESKTGDGYFGKKSAKARSGKANHVCATCDKLMVPPQCSPMLLVPCGHTLCENCSRRTKYCGMCGNVVESFTPNVMLKRIITDYNRNESESTPNIDQSSHSIKDILHYREEYQNLVTREEILQEESDNIDRRIIQLSQDLSGQNQQIDNIQAQEEKVAGEMRVLQEKLQSLQAHRQEYETSCQKLQIDYKKEKNRLLMIKETVDSIRKQKEKVKLLAEDGY